MRRPSDSQRGIALIIVLWGVTLIAVLTAALARSTSLEARRFGNLVAAATARAQIDSGIAVAFLALTDPEPTAAWRGDGEPHRFALGDTQFTVRIEAETGKVDLNSTRPDLLEPFLKQMVGAPVMAAIVQANRTALAAQQPGHRRLLSVAELASVPGMTAAAFQRLVAATTIYNPSGRVDWRTAAPTTLAALPGMTGDLIAQLLARRSETAYTPDVATARSLAQAGADLDGAHSEIQVYRMHVTVRTAAHAIATADVILRPRRAGGEPYQILEWREPSPSPDLS